MPVPVRVIVTLVIILGIGVGAGALVFGLMVHGGSQPNSEAATFTAVGTAILASSGAALVAHLAGGFRGIDDDR